jgi:hypothetical protein
MASVGPAANATPPLPRQPLAHLTSLVSMASVPSEAVAKLHDYLRFGDMAGGPADDRDAGDRDATELPVLGVRKDAHTEPGKVYVDADLHVFVQTLFKECGLQQPKKGSKPSEQAWSHVFEQLCIRNPADNVWSPLREVWSAKLLDFLPRVWIKVIEGGEHKPASNAEVRRVVDVLKEEGQVARTVVYRVVPVKKLAAVTKHLTIEAEQKRPDDGRGVTLAEYIRALQAHVSAGSKVALTQHHKYFISATADFGTALWYSRAGALAVIRIDLSHDAAVISIPVGDGASSIFRSAMARNYALSSSEVVIDSAIPANAYQRIKFRARAPLQRFDLNAAKPAAASTQAHTAAFGRPITLPNFDPAKIVPSSVKELSGLTHPVKVTMEVDSGQMMDLVVKLGAKDGDGDGVSSSEHRQNARHLVDEFFARVVYDAAGALVPSCSLQLVPIEIVNNDNDEPFSDAATAGTQLVWVLLSEYIESTGAATPMNDAALLGVLAKNIAVDLVLQNLDAMGNKFSNVIIISDDVRRSAAHQHAYRVDMGACWGNKAAKSTSSPRCPPQAPGDILNRLENEMHSSRANTPLACLREVLKTTKEKDIKAAVARLHLELPGKVLQRIIAGKYSDTRFFELCHQLRERLLAWKGHYDQPAPAMIAPTAPVATTTQPYPATSSPTSSQRPLTAQTLFSSPDPVHVPDPSRKRPVEHAAGGGQGAEMASVRKRAATATTMPELDLMNHTDSDAHMPLNHDDDAGRAPHHDAASPPAGPPLRVTPRRPRAVPARSEEELIWIVGPQQSKDSVGDLARKRTFIDVTSKSTDKEFQRFSPFFAHGRIPVPFVRDGTYSESVEGVWQGLKVFENEPIDARKFNIKTMKKIKRGRSKKLGDIKGHYAGEGKPLLSYEEARRQIYIPTYRWVLQMYLSSDVDKLLDRLRAGEKFIFRDYYVNGDIADLHTPLSHASLLKDYLLELLRTRPHPV